MESKFKEGDIIVRIDTPNSIYLIEGSELMHTAVIHELLNKEKHLCYKLKYLGEGTFNGEVITAKCDDVDNRYQLHVISQRNNKLNDLGIEDGN